MQKNSYSTVEFFANLVTIIGAIIAVLQWISGSQFTLPSTISSGTASSILLFYMILSSYGTAQFLKRQVVNSESTVITSSICVFLYAYSCYYVFLITANSVHAPNIQDQFFHLQNGVFIYLFLHLFTYIITLLYPDGPQNFITNVFTARGWGAFLWTFGYVILIITVYTMMIHDAVVDNNIPLNIVAPMFKQFF